MDETIRVHGCDYYPASCLSGDAQAALLKDVGDRHSYVSSHKVSLKGTCGVYVPIDSRNILFIIDPASVTPNSEEWCLIGEIAAKLTACYPQLTAQAKAALADLKAVVFVRAPDRSYADVGSDSFVYDVDEFRRSDGHLISAAYALSNIVHDSNHLWMHDQGQVYIGNAAEITCWTLQIDNAAAIGLEPYEVDFLKSLVADPMQVAQRIDQDPLANAARYACAGAKSGTALA